VFSKPEVINELERLHGEYILVPAEKAFNNCFFACKAHYFKCIVSELCINSTFDDPTYTQTTHTKDEILQNQSSVLNTFNIPANKMDKYELTCLYWILKLHKILYKQKYIVGFSKCSTKPLHLPLTKY
jgi:hypothetical protein